MNGSFWFKNPHRLPCPQCGSEVDMGGTFRALKRISSGKLACNHCGAQLKIVSRSYGLQIVCCMALMLGLNFLDLSTFIRLAVSIPLLALAFWFVGKEIQSVHLIKEQKESC